MSAYLSYIAVEKLYFRFMQRILIAFGALVLSAALAASCSKPSCVYQPVKHVVFYAPGSVNEITDTAVSLYKYNPDGKFDQLAEAFSSIPLDKNKVMNFPDNGSETYDYDWVVVGIPSGNNYTIAQLAHDDKNVNGNNCSSTITYNLNGEAVKIPGNPNSTTPLYTSDIKILWQ